MKKIKIEEDLNDDGNFLYQPLRYRISISFYDDIILKREYFRIGFLTGEEDDNFYIDSEINSYNTSYCTKYISFMTQNFDEKYLEEKEKELLDIAYKQILKSKKKLKIKLKEKIESIKEEINNYDNYLEYQEFKKQIRKEKIKNIKYESKNSK